MDSSRMDGWVFMPEAWWRVAGGANHRDSVGGPGIHQGGVPTGTPEMHDDRGGDDWPCGCFRRPSRDAILNEMESPLHNPGGFRSQSRAAPTGYNPWCLRHPQQLHTGAEGFR